MAKKRLSTKLALTPSGTLPKADVLERWQQLPAGKQLNPAAIPHGTTGSSYGEDTIRITGSLSWCDAVLSNLRGLLRHENTKRVLEVAFSEQKEKNTSKRVKGKYVVYLKLKEKARTTRAKAHTPASRAAPARSTKAAPRTAQRRLDDPPATRYRNIEDATTALTKLGFSARDAQQRITKVTDAHGLELESAHLIKLALNA